MDKSVDRVQRIPPGFWCRGCGKIRACCFISLFFLARMRKYLEKIMKACLGNGITGRISFVFGTEPKGVQCGYVLATI